MALNWNLENIEGHERLCWRETGVTKPDGDPEREMNPVTNALIWAMMTTFTGGSIAADNVDEVYARIHITQLVDGPWLRNSDGSDRLITWSDVHDHIGLWTNAYEKNKRSFKESIMKNLFLRGTRAAERGRGDHENQDGLRQLEAAVEGKAA